MNTFAYVINCLLPILSLILLLLGISMYRTSYVLTAFWLALFSLLLHYRCAGGEILGSYFDYKNTSIYTINLLILLTSLIYLLFKTDLLPNKATHYLAIIFSICLIAVESLLMINLWVNAYFIEHRLKGTAIMQVVSFSPPEYCSYRYVFYKVGVDKKISYLCPNHFGLIPSVGHFSVAPEFIARQLLQTQLKNLVVKQ